MSFLNVPVLIKLSDLNFDVFTIAGLVLVVSAVIYFFIAVKPVFESKWRINRYVQRRLELDKASQVYNERTGKKSDEAKSPNQKKSNNNCSKYQGYQAFLRRNHRHHDNKQLIKHARFSKVSGTTNSFFKGA